MTEFIYGLTAVILVSFVSLIGIGFLSFKDSLLKTILIYFVSFSAGAMLGDVFLHLIPELVEEGMFTIQSSIYILAGIVMSFILEKIIHWRHCHLPFDDRHAHRFAYMNIFGDVVHNFIDGIILGAGFVASIPVGIATTIAVLLHEIPQEIGDFAVLLHGGFTRKKALLMNFLTALSAIAGFLIAFSLSASIANFNNVLISFAIGSFIYIAGSDLIPELHKEEGLKKGMLQLLLFVAGMVIMGLLLGLE